MVKLKGQGGQSESPNLGLLAQCSFLSILVNSIERATNRKWAKTGKWLFQLHFHYHGNNLALMLPCPWKSCILLCRKRVSQWSEMFVFPMALEACHQVLNSLNFHNSHMYSFLCTILQTYRTPGRLDFHTIFTWIGVSVEEHCAGIFRIL